MTISVVIPVYNEETTIRQVLKKVRDVKLGRIKKEIIVVDDGSTDGTARELKREVREKGLSRHHVSIINLGKGAAIRFGLKYSTGEIIIIQDADLELDPNEYKNLVAPIIAGSAKVVYGSRFLRSGNNFSTTSHVGNRVLTGLTNILFGVKLTDMETAYKVFTREVIDQVAPKLRCVEFDFEPEVTAWVSRLGFGIYEVPIGYKPRSRSMGKHITWKDGIAAIYCLFRCKFLSK